MNRVSCLFLTIFLFGKSLKINYQLVHFSLNQTLCLSCNLIYKIGLFIFAFDILMISLSTLSDRFNAPVFINYDVTLT